MRTKRCREKNIHRPYRLLASKQDQPPRLNVQRLSIAQIGESSYIIIHPSEARIKATDLIDMIKEDHVITNTGEKVQSQDLVIATTQLLTTAGSDGSSAQSSSSAPTDVWKRQANAFIRYRRENGKKLQALIPEYSEADISKFLGAVWKITPETVKQKYRQEWSASVAEQKEKNPNFRYNLSNKAVEGSPQHPVADESCYSTVLVPNGVNNQGAEAQNQTNHKDSWNDIHNCLDLPDGALDEFFSSLLISYQQDSADGSDGSSSLVDTFPDDFNAYKFLDDWHSMMNLCTTPHSETYISTNLFQFPDHIGYNPLMTPNPIFNPADPLALWTEVPNANIAHIQQNDDANQHNIQLSYQ